jgi:hypothetical protein
MDVPPGRSIDGFSSEDPNRDDLDRIEIQISNRMVYAQEYTYRAEQHYASGHWAEAQSAAAVAQAHIQMAQFYQMRLSEHLRA